MDIRLLYKPIVATHLCARKVCAYCMRQSATKMQDEGPPAVKLKTIVPQKLMFQPVQFSRYWNSDYVTSSPAHFAPNVIKILKQK